MQPVQDHGGDAIKFEPFTPPSTAELDELIPAYKFIEFIDCGGMGAVYKAVQKSLNRTVAVKLLPQVHRNKESFGERFKREAHALAALNHPHIVAVHDFGETPDGQMYYAMEFVSGMDLQHLLKRDPPGPKQILKIITQVCGALQFAHERGIVHRDIKPANILIDERGNVKVADFGLAKVVGPQSSNYTATGTTLGTPDYIAPEALDQGGKIDHRADIYSLGVMIYELLTGHVPKGIWEPPSIRSGSDKRIDVVVNKAMQNNPDKRYQHVSDMTQVLEKLLINSDNWKNFRRPAKSAVHSSQAELGPIATGAVTLKLTQAHAVRKNWLTWAAAALLVMGAGMAVAWQAGWLHAAPPPSVPTAVSPTSANIATAPVQLELARWVFDHGGFLNVRAETSDEKQMGGSADIWQADDLPAEPFIVWRVAFAAVGAALSDETLLEELVALMREAGTVGNLNLRGTALPPEAFRHLATIDTLTSLDLTACATITRNALPHFVACKRLVLLRIGGTRTPLDPAVIDELRELMPDCTIHAD